MIFLLGFSCLFAPEQIESGAVLLVGDALAPEEIAITSLARIGIDHQREAENASLTEIEASFSGIQGDLVKRLAIVNALEL